MLQEQESAASVFAELLYHEEAPWAGAVTVLAVDEDGGIVIDRLGRRLHCRRAHSCLTPPEARDRVWAVSDGRSEHYVCTVLHRPDAGPVRLQVQGDLELHAIDGDLRLLGGKRLQLRSEQELQADTGTLAFAAREARLDADAVQVRSNRIETRAGLLRVVGRVLESAAERIVQASRHSVRSVETVDYLRAGQIDYSASADARLHAEHVVVTADRVAKIDGEQIHIG
ncbi:DUF3540 domain-containing protein [Lysobacter sp. BMK333-48F3]|uniref:DUF3540 domain-containing protein n=1 Tax=Lysobacter sp. BMK333-48F3 TaxID=2867962 RepID=UPI001C8C5A73|nr:DUF3540 domain-containing protein [Lysobacter sp. BMK333-48F3]MBX9403035.1 DUF3540 domain-containing protein [Lysobacter sp. BMK333-48F3]